MRTTDDTNTNVVVLAQSCANPAKIGDAKAFTPKPAKAKVARKPKAKKTAPKPKSRYRPEGKDYFLLALSPAAAMNIGPQNRISFDEESGKHFVQLVYNGKKDRKTYLTVTGSLEALSSGETFVGWFEAIYDLSEGPRALWIYADLVDAEPQHIVDFMLGERGLKPFEQGQVLSIAFPGYRGSFGMTDVKRLPATEADQPAEVQEVAEPVVAPKKPRAKKRVAEADQPAEAPVAEESLAPEAQLQAA